MQSLSIFSRKCGLLVSAVAALAWCFGAGSSLAQTNPPPVITKPPVSGIAAFGEDFTFRTEAAGTPPLSYQWYFRGTNIAGATNPSLVLRNLTNSHSGYYAVVVTNVGGAVTSTPARLLLGAPFPRRLTVGRILFGDYPQVAVPIELRANGLENRVSFSLAYDTNTFANPVFLSGYPNASVVVNAEQPGSIGVLFTLPPANTLVPGYTSLGVMRFDVVGDANPLDGGLRFTSNPLSLAAVDLDNNALAISAKIEPQFVLVTDKPTLDRQSGLMKHQIIVYNPGTEMMTNVNVVPQNLGLDTTTNLINFHNNMGSLTNYPYRDPLIDITCDCGCQYSLEDGAGCDFNQYLSCANSSADCVVDSASKVVNLTYAQVNFIGPGESLRVTLEYYTRDHLTAPPVTYSVYQSDQMRFVSPTNYTTVGITTNRFINGTFIIEFPTTVGRTYFVEYDENPGFTNSLISLPQVTGTGSRVQWIDTGPPRTFSAPSETRARFYRVLEIN